MPEQTTQLTLEQQERLIRSLKSHAPFPETCSAVDLIETHISWVLLCGNHAYKIKKAIDLGFLDFSTLAKRKHYCEEELRLNRRLAPTLYLDVIAIGGSIERPTVTTQPESTDNPMEYAVKMKRFRQEELFDRMLQESRLDAAQIDHLAERLAAFHQQQSHTPPAPQLGTPEAVHTPVRDNFSVIRQHVRDPALLARLDAIAQWADRQFDLLHDRIAERKQQGFVRECHGDLHLGNIAVHEGEVIVFDGIEFNPALYWIDVVNEVAFLAMDLEDHGRTDLAWRFLNRYLGETGDCEAVQLLRYYLCYRAMVRAKVAAIRAGQHDAADAHSECAQYLDLALRYSQPQPAFLAIAHGLSGSGKSTVCAPLANRSGALLLRSDQERRRLFGQGAYGAAATERTYQRLLDCAEHALAAQFPVIVDATFLAPERRQAFAELAAAQDVRFYILHFESHVAALRKRVALRMHAGKDLSEADVPVLEQQLAHYQPLTAAEAAQTIVLDTDRQDVAGLLASAMARLRSNGGQA